MGLKDLASKAANTGQKIANSKAVKAGKQAAKVGKKAYDVGGSVNKFQHDSAEHGFDEAVADRVKKHAKKGANKLLKAGVKKLGEKLAATKLGAAITSAVSGILAFLATPPIGWIVSAILIIGLLFILGQPQDRSITDETSTNEKIVALQYACPPEQKSDVSFDSDGTVHAQTNSWLKKIGGKLDVAKRIIEWGKEHSLSGGHIATLLAIGARESTLDPTLENPAGSVRGIWQWSDATVSTGVNGDRMKWLRDQGLDVNDLENQLKLAEYEFGTRWNGRLVQEFVKYQSTSEADMIEQLKAFNYWFEGVEWSDGQSKTDAIVQYYKDVLDVFPELKDLKMGADMPAKFQVAESDSNNKSGKVAKTQIEQCGGSATVAGGDAFAQAMVKDAFRYWNGGIDYSQELRTTNMKWNSGNSQVSDGYLDCSSFVTTVLMNLGVEGVGLGSTETLFGYEGTILQEISRDEVTVGDIFVSGIKGQSGGNGGHTGIFLNKNWIIHCSSGAWGGNGDNGGDIYINPFPEDHFGLGGGKFYRVKNRKLPTEKLPEPKEYIDITTQAGLDKAVASGKLKNPMGIKAN